MEFNPILTNGPSAELARGASHGSVRPLANARGSVAARRAGLELRGFAVPLAHARGSVAALNRDRQGAFSMRA